MKKNTFLPEKLIAALGAVALAVTAGATMADTFENIYDTKLSGANSVPPVHTTANGTFTTKIVEGMEQIHYSLHYDDVIGAPLAAHIHFAQPFANGAPLVTICDTDRPEIVVNGVVTQTEINTPNIPFCPANGEYLDGIITAADIQAIPAQGVHALNAAGTNGQEVFDQLVLFITVGFTYFNLHTAQHHDAPTPLPLVNELRGQLEVNDHPFPVKY